MRRAVLQATRGEPGVVSDLEPRERRRGRHPVARRSDAIFGRPRCAPPLFGAAAANDAPRAAVVGDVAARLGVAPDALDAALFADLPGERAVRAPDPIPTPAEIALHTNLALAQTVVMRAAHLSLRVEGGLRPIVRLAKFRGLLCNVALPPEAGALPRLDISGPFSLFRHTLVYGRALAELLPHLAWCARFELAAVARLRGRLARVSMESGDPIFPARAPAPFDSRLEERFAADVAPPGARTGT